MINCEMNEDDERHSFDEELEVYDPHQHRPEKKTVSDFGSLANLVKSAAGTGLFAMPNAFASVGMAVGIFGTIFMGILITVCLQMLLRTHYEMCVKSKRPRMSYGEVASVSLTAGIFRDKISPQSVTLMIDLVMLTCYIGIGAVYMIFVSGVVQECIDIEKSISQSHYTIILLPFFLAANMIDRPNIIAHVSVVGNVLLMIPAVIGITYALMEGINGNWEVIQPDLELYPKFLGIVFFAMCSPGLVLVIEHNMKTPKNYTKTWGVLNWGMFFLVSLHVIVGTLGYAKWGKDSFGNFIRNHEQLDPATMTALIMQALAVFMTYGLQCYVPISILSKLYTAQSIRNGYFKASSHMWDLLVRISVTIVTCALAVAIPHLHLFISLVGGLSVATLGFLIPVILYLASNHKNLGRFNSKLILGIFLLIFGLTGMICSTITSISSISQYSKT